MTHMQKIAVVMVLISILSAKEGSSSIAEFGLEEFRATVSQNGKTLEAESGIVRTWFQIPEFNIPGDARTIAESFLAANSKQIGFENSLSEPSFWYEKKSRGITFETYQQTIDGIPVFRGDITVTVNRENRVSFLRNNTRIVDNVSSRSAVLSSEAARQIAVEYINPAAAIRWEAEPIQNYLVQDKTAYLTWVIEFETPDPLGDWRLFVDAVTGEVRALENRIVFDNGSGMIWDPDPLSSAYAEYGDAGFSDNNDADTDQLNGERFTADLLDITYSDEVYQLLGPHVSVVDWDSPTVPVVTSTTPDGFVFTRTESGFEDVLVYYFVDMTQRYIQSLGFDNVNNESQTSDPHGANGADNSYYFPGSDAIAWGEGGVDDAEDADVILHEYGHAIQHDQVPSWGGGDEGAMGEGFGDYWAGSHSLTISDHHSNWVFNWDGHNPFWSGRILDANYHYPEDNSGGVHNAGQLWSAGLWDCHTDPGISRENMDALVLQNHFMIGSSATMADAAAAIIQADIDMFGAEHYNLLVQHFGDRGFIDPDDYPPMSDDLDPNPPSNLVAFSDETMPTSIQLTWDDPTELFGGGEIGPFQINIARDGTSLMEVGQGVESYLDEGLGEGQSYSYTFVTQLITNDSTSYPVHVTGFAGGAPSILIWDMGNSSSNAETILNVISTASGRSAYVTNDLFMFGEDLTMAGFEAIFVLLGIYSNNYVLGEGAQVNALINYLENGGNLYMEGGDTWAYDSPTTLHSYFGIDGLDDGTGDLSFVAGLPGTFTEGLEFTYSGENSWIDHLAPVGESAFSILENSDVDYICGVANATDIYRTVGTSFQLGGLEENEELTALVAGIMEFFNVGVVAPCEKGDLNSDGVVDVFDVIKIVNIILGIEPDPTEDELCAADYDDDGNIDVFDIIKVVNYILGIGAGHAVEWYDANMFNQLIK